MNSSSGVTLYQVLGIETSATEEEIRRGYKHKALETHPDKLSPGATQEEKEAAEERFRQVYDAFIFLSDSQKRRAYDVRNNIRRDYSSKPMSEDGLRRMRERDEWARQHELEHQARMAEIKEQQRLAREQMAMRMFEAREHGKMVEAMLKDLSNHNPEWEARRDEVLKRRARRESSYQTSRGPS